MKLIDADQNKLVVEMTTDDWLVIGGVFSMIDVMKNPDWEDSTGQADTAITPEEFDRAFKEWVALTKGPAARLFLIGKGR